MLFHFCVRRTKQREKNKKKKNILNPSQQFLFEKVTVTKEIHVKNIEKLNYVNSAKWKQFYLLNRCTFSSGIKEILKWRYKSSKHVEEKIFYR